MDQQRLLENMLAGKGCERKCWIWSQPLWLIRKNVDHAWIMQTVVGLNFVLSVENNFSSNPFGHPLLNTSKILSESFGQNLIYALNLLILHFGNLKASILQNLGQISKTFSNLVLVLWLLAASLNTNTLINLPQRKQNLER